LLLWNGQDSYATIGKGSVSKVKDKNNSLGVLSGIAPLAERFVYLNFRYLLVVCYRLDHPLKRRLETLRELNLGRCIAGYSDFLPLNIVSSESFTRHDLPALLATHFFFFLR
jgi:hypothetical protein